MAHTLRFTMNGLYQIEADANEVKVSSLVTGALMAHYDVRKNVRPRDAFYKVFDNVRDCALRARWICQARDSRAATMHEIALIAIGVSRWEREFSETYPGPSYLKVMETQRDRLTREIDLAETAQSAALKG